MTPIDFRKARLKKMVENGHLIDVLNNIDSFVIADYHDSDECYSYEDCPECGHEVEVITPSPTPNVTFDQNLLEDLIQFALDVLSKRD